MKRIAVIICLVFGIVLVSPTNAFATITPIAATGGTNLSSDSAANGNSPSWTTLTAITVAEASNSQGKNDISAGTGVTLVLKAPAGFEFNTGQAPSISFTSGQDISSASVALTDSTTITATLTVTGVAGNDSFSITGLQVRPTTAGPLATARHIYRPSSGGGTAVLSGITASSNGSSGDDFGPLSQTTGTFTKLQTLAPGETAAPGTVNGKSSAPTARTAGTAFNVTVNAVDAYWNVIASITHAVTLSSSDSAAALTGSTALVSGTKNLSVTLKTAGSQTVTATDSVNGFTGTSSSLTVNPDNASKLTIQTQPSATATAGASFSQQPVIRIEDQFGNLVNTDSSTVVKAARSTGTGTLLGTLSVTAVNGIVTYAGLNYQVAETMTVAFTKTGLTSATSQNVVVSSAAASRLGIQTQPSSTATAGTVFPQQPVVRIEDPFGNLVTSDSSTVVTAARATGTATLQGTLTATAANGLATFGNLSYLVAETMTINFTSGSLTSATSANVVVSAAAFVKLQILAPGETTAPGSASGKTGAPTAQTAGSSFVVTVNSVDAYWNIVSSTHSIAITTSDPIAVPPVNASLSGGTKNRTITLKTAGSQTVTATDATEPSKTAATTSSITVGPDTANQLGIQTQPSTTATAGVSFTQQPVVRIEDQFGNLVTTDNSTIVTAARSAGSGTLQGTLTATAVNGLASFSNLSHQTATTISILFTKTGLTSATSGNIVVSPAAANQLVFKTQPASATAGSSFGTQPVVGTQDAFGNDSNVGLASSLTVTVTLNAGVGPLQGTTGLNIGTSGGNGTATLTDLRLDAAGSDKQLTASASGLTSSVSSVFTVVAGAASKLQLLVPGETSAPGTSSGKTGTPNAQVTGTAFDVTVNAVDAFWNLVSSTHNIGITSSDPNASLPANANLSGGTKVRTVTLNTVGTQTLTAVDNNASPFSSNTSPSLTVGAGAFIKLQILLPGETASPGSATGKTGTSTAQTAGLPFSVTVSAVDANWNVVTSATDNVGITTTDSNAALPANNTLSNGTRTFSVTPKTAGSWTVTASDISQPSITANTSPSVTVNAGALAKLQVLAPGETAAPGTLTGKTGTPTSHTAGASFSVTVNAVDANWNLVNTVSDTIHVTSSDANVVPPADIALASGTKSRTVTLKTAGTQTVTASDLTNTSITSNTSASIPVVATTASQLGIQTQPSSTATAGIAFSQQPVIRIEDQYGNLVTTDNTSIVTAARSAGSGTLQGTLTATAANGLATFSGLNHLEANTISIIFTKTGLTSITSGNIAVSAGPFTKLQLLAPGETAAPATSSGKTGTPDAQIGDNPFDVTVNAVDANWNVVGSVTDTIHITSSDGGAVLPANAALTSGTKNFTVRLITVGTATVSAADASDSGKTSDTSSSITVSSPPYTAATGGSAISADTTGGTYTALTGPSYTEVATGNVGTGTIILNAPSGFIFDIGGVAPTVTITGSSVSSRNINNVATGTAVAMTAVSTTQLTFIVTSKSSNGVKCTLDWQNIRVRPSVGTPLASGNISVSGTAAFAGVSSSSNFGSLAEAAGAANKLAFTTQPGNTTYGNTMAGVVVQIQDQFSNPVSQSGTAITLTLNGGGTLGGTTSVAAASTGSATFSALTGSNAGNGKTLSATGGGLLGATSGTFNVTTRAITVTAVTDTKVYDATTSSSGTPIITNGSLATGDSVTWTQTFNTKTAGANKTLTPAGTVNDGNNGNNYITTLSSIGTGTITARALTVSATGVNKVYDANTTATATLSDNRVSGDSITDSYASATYANKNVGTAKTVSVSGISISGTDAANYTVNTTTTTTANVTAKALTVSATGMNKVYDGNTTATVTLSDDRVVGDSLSDNYTAAIFLDKQAGSDKVVNVSGISILGADAGNYTLASTTTSTTASITIAVLTVTADNASRSYGASNPTLTATFTGFVNNETLATSGITGSVSLSTAATGTSAVGNYTITAAAGSLAGGNYSFAFVNGTLTVTAAPLMITANNDNKTYGTSKIYGAGSAAFTSSGLQNNETIGSVTITDTNNGGATTASAGGSYSLTPTAATGGSFTANNYTITYIAGTLTVNVAALTITANAQSKTYGTALPLGTTAFTTSGLQNSDTITAVTLTANGSPTGDLATAAVGTYTISLSAPVFGVGSASNYAISYATGTLTVNARALTIAASDQSKTYGTALSLGTTAFATSGLQNSDTVTAVTLIASGSPLGDAASASAGIYTITPSAALFGAGSPSNYTITYTSGTLTVTAKALTITASAQNKIYGATLALGTTAFTTSGIQNSDTVTAVTLTASGSPAGDSANAAAGAYTIIPSTPVFGVGAASNYAITYTVGTLTVAAKALTITASAQSKSYGSALTLGTTAFTTSGLQNSDMVSAVTLLASGSPTGDSANAAAGTYTITPSTAVFDVGAASNYTITYTAGPLTVTAKALTITASAQSKTYGTALALGTSLFTTTTMVGTESIGSVTLTANGGTAAADPAGTYVITPSAAVANAGTSLSNYSITFAPGALTVNARAITLTGTRNYDGTTDALASILAISNIVGSDDVSPSGTGALASKNTGSQALTLTSGALSGLTLSGAASANYTVVGGSGSVTITARPIVLTGTRVYDGTTSAPASILAFSNKIASDTVSLSGAGVLASKSVGSQSLTLTSGALTGLTLGGTDSTNYTTANGSGSVTITALPVTLSGTRVYDGTTDVASSILTISNKAGSDTVSLSGTATVASKNIGSQALASTSGVLMGLALSGTDASNYSVAGGSGSVAITPRSITVAAAASSKTYDGGTSSSAAPTITTGTLATGDIANFTQTFNNKGVGTNKTITPAGSVADGNSGANYTAAFVNVTTGTITAKTLTVVGITANNKAYDGTSTATLNTSSAALAGVVVGDVVNLSVGAAVGIFSDKNVGANKTVTVSGLVISGDDSGNYTLTQPTTTANITAAQATVALGSLIQMYDGTVKSASATTSPSGLTVTLTYDGSAVPPSATGAYTVVGTIQDSNYTGDATGTFYIVPAIINVAGPASGSYRAGQALDFTVTYSGNVTINTAAGTPRIALTIGDTTRQAGYVSGTGTAALTFRYSVQAGDEDTDGIASTAPIDLNGGTIRDAAGNDVALTFTVPITTSVLVDTTMPTVTIMGPSAAIARGGPVTYTVTYADANFDSSSLTPDKVTLNRNGTTADGTVTVTGSGTSYTVAISTITGDGSLGISIAAGAASDKAGNTSPAATSTTFTVDNTAPSISISAPSATITRTASVTYTVAYADTGSSGVNAISLADANITLNRTGIANGAISVAGAGSSTRTVTISGITGDGSLGILIAAATATDVAGNTTPSAISGTFTVDNTAPTVTISAPSVSVTKGGPVTYTLTYADAGGSGISSIGLVNANITLNKTGTANGTVAVSGSGVSTRLVTISGIAGEGSLGISVASGTATDVGGNLAGAAGSSASFVVDNTAPTISIGAPSATFTANTSVSYTVTYADVEGSGISAITLASADVTLIKTGSANAATISIAGSNTSTRTVTISGITGNGTLGISVVADTAADAAGNLTPAPGTSATFTVDNAAPTLSIGAPSATITSKTPVSYIVTYADSNLAANTLSASKVILNKTGTANGTVSVTGTGDTRTVTISSIAGTGTLGISILEGTASDTAGNSAAASGPSTTFIVDNTAPTITIGAPSSSFASAGPVTYTVTYSDANFSSSTLSAANVTLNRNGTANGTVTVAGSGNTRDVTISNVTGNGSLGISIAAGTATDQAGNTAPVSVASTAVTVDNTSPTVTIGAPSRSFTGSAPVSYAVVYTDSNFNTSTLSASNITLNKTGTANGTVSITGSGANYSVTISGIIGNGTLGISVAGGTATDKASNASTASSASATFTVDNITPTVTISAPSATLATTGPVVYTITYADANFDSSTLTAANVSLNTTGSATGTVGVSGIGSTRTVTISSITGDGTLGISLVSGTAADLAGNLAPAAGPSATFTVDQTVPSVAISAPSTTLTTHGPLTYSVAFSDPGNPSFILGAFSASDVTLNSTGTTSGTVGVSGTGNTRTVTVSNITGDGSIGISVREGVVVGSTGKSSVAAGPSATCAVDNTSPSIAISAPSSDFANSGPITYTVTYTDSNFTSATLTTANVSLNSTGTATGTLSVAGSGNTRTVTVSGISGNGTLGISIVAGTSTDLAGNTAPAPTSSATFTVDNIAPTMTIGSPSNTFTRSGPISYTVAYSDANFSKSTLTADDVTLNRSGTANGSISVTGSGTSYTVAISSVTGEGSLGISILSGTAIDQAGNSAPVSAASETFTTDNTAPAIAISAPSSTITANGPITFTVTYADANLNMAALTGSNVSLNQTGTADGTIEVSGSGSSYQVLIFGITGDGALSVSIAAGTATDRAGNSAPAATSDTFVVDHTAPTLKISAPSANIASSGSVTYRVTYSDDNFNPATLTPDQVTLRKTGTASGVIGVSGTGEDRTVTISNITGDGTLSILIAAGSATDLAGNPAPAAGPSATFTVDNTAPAISVSAPSASYTRTDSVTFTVAYADANLDVTTLAIGNITLTKTASATGTLNVTPSGNTRTVTISGISGDGTLGISIAQGTARDTAGNLAPAATSVTFTVDNTAPTVTISAPSSNVADGVPVTYTVAYADANFSTSNLTVDQIILNRNGTGADGILSVTGSGTTYTVQISSITGTGSLGISIASGTASDLANNLAPAVASTNFTVDNTAPTLTIGAPSRSITAAGPVTFPVTYADANFATSSLTPAQVSLNRNGTANGTVTVTGSGTSYVVTISNVTGNGALGVSIAAGTASDLADNLAPAAVSATFSVDDTAPTVTIGAPSATFAKAGPVTYSVTYADANFETSSLTPGNVTLIKTGSANGNLSIAGSGLSYTVTVSGLTGEGSLGISIAPGTAIDLAGNSSAATGSSTFTVDNSAPILTLSAPSASFADGLPVTYTLSYTDANFSACTLTASNVTLNRTGTANGALSVSGTGITRTVSISSISGDGTLGISIAPGTAIDHSGNLALAAGPSTTFIVDNTHPVVTIGAPSASFAKSDPVNYTVTYADTNFGASALTAISIVLNRAGTANGSVSLTGSGTVYTVTISNITGDGALGISVPANTAIDLAGNSALASGPSATFTVDNTPPTVALSAPSSSFARSGPVTYLVAYADANFNASTLASANVLLNRTGIANGTVGISGSGSNYTVTISNITGDGTLGLTITAGTASDFAGNLALALGPSETFTVDNTVPTAVIGSPSTQITAKGTVDYLITYPDTDIDKIKLGDANIVLNKSGNADGVLSVSGSGNTRTVTVSNITGDGTLGISLVAGTATDLTGNPAAPAGPSATFTVDNTAPTITSATSVAGTYRTEFNYTITTVETPSTFNATGLPPGLILDSVTGIISGKPTQTGVFNVALTATDTAGNVGTTNLVITIGRFLLTVTANSASRLYGLANPTFTGSVTGVQNSDNITATFTTEATAQSPVGGYPIIPSLADPKNKLSNYTVVTNTGTMTVDRFPLSAMANDVSRNYGAPNPDFTGNLVGIQNSDRLTLTFSTPAVLKSPPGTYTITPAVSDPDARLANYALTTTPGTLTVLDRVSFPGIAHDGYVANATVFFDANKNSIKDANEPSTQTDGQGNFTLVLGSQFDLNGNGQIEPSEGSLVLVGGVDIATGLPMKTLLKAPPGSTVVNPLTTVLTAAIELNPTVSVADTQARVNTALNIPAGVNLTTYNPLAGAAVSDSNASAVLNASAKVQDTLVQVSALLGGVSAQTQSQIANTVANVVAEKIASGQSLDVSQSSTVQSVIQRSAQIVGVTLSANTQQTSADVIAEGNRIKDDAVAGAATPLEASKEITRAQVVTQGQVPEVLRQIAANPSTSDDALASISGTALAEKIEAAPVGDVQGDDLRPGTFYFGQTTFRMQPSNPDQAMATVYRTSGNRGQVNLVIALSTTGGPQRATVPVTFADREITKTVDLSNAVRFDNQLYSQATVALRLILATDAPPLANLGAPATATLAKIAPTIISRSSDQVVVRGDPTSLKISANAAPLPDYQWQKNGVDLPAQTGSSLFIRSSDFADSGDYTVIVTNPAGSVSTTVKVSIVERVRILSPPESQTSFAGEAVTFKIAATGTQPFQFQWLKNERVIAGATNATLTLKNLKLDDSGRYTVLVTNPAGSVISPEAALTIEPFRAPTIVSQLLSQNVIAGSNVTLSVGVIGTPPLSFEWQKEDKKIAGVTGPILELSSISLSDGGRYSVTVRSPYGTASSQVALTVYSPPVITGFTKDREVTEGENVNLGVEATGSATLVYHWFKDERALANASGPTLNLIGVRGSDSGQYRVVVSNPFGEATSPAMNLHVIQTLPPNITIQPASRSALPGAYVELTVTADGIGPLSYQWLKDDGLIPGATNRVLTLASIKATDLGAYSVIVKNLVGEVRSVSASLSLETPNVTIKAPVRLADGRFVFSFTTEPNRQYVIEVSSDVQHWRTLSAIISDKTTIEFTDTEAPSETLRFYRVHVVP